MANRRCIVILENIRAGVELRGEDTYPASIKGERIMDKGNHEYTLEQLKEEHNFEELENSINCIIDSCIKKDILADFLSENRNKVVEALAMELIIEKWIMMEEAREEGGEDE